MLVAALFVTIFVAWVVVLNLLAHKENKAMTPEERAADERFIQDHFLN